MLELPVVCGSSSLKPEVASSGFSFFVLLNEIAKLLQEHKIFLKDAIVNSTTVKRQYKKSKDWKRLHY